jgi:hypothetical protein
MCRSVILLAVVLALHEPAAGWEQDAPTVEEVGWIAGCWQHSAGARLIEEQWMRPRAGLMLGVSRTGSACPRGAGPPALPTARAMMEIVSVQS